MNKSMAAPVVNKKFDDDNDDSGVDDIENMDKIIPSKNEFKKMNQVQPAGAQAHLRPSMVGSLNNPAGDEGNNENV